MNTRHFNKHTALHTGLMVLALALGSCTGDDGDALDDGESGDDTGGTMDMCDPVGADPDMAMLLNAPLEADVEVVVKTPQHPGMPGPDGLP